MCIFKSSCLAISSTSHTGETASHHRATVSWAIVVVAGQRLFQYTTQAGPRKKYLHMYMYAQFWPADYGLPLLGPQPEICNPGSPGASLHHCPHAFPIHGRDIGEMGPAKIVFHTLSNRHAKCAYVSQSIAFWSTTLLTFGVNRLVIAVAARATQYPCVFRWIDGLLIAENWII